MMDFDELSLNEKLFEQARMLVQRLERISADSIWARRSSGHRGALLHCIEQHERDQGNGQHESSAEEIAHLQALIDGGFEFLDKAAQERLR